MVSGIQGAQELIVLVLGLFALALEVYALLDAVRQRADAFQAAGKLTKPLWVTFLAVAAAIGFVTVFNPLAYSIFTIVGVVAAGVYLADVRPALRSVSGGGGGSGPYGRW
jgi:hypothetical protein